MTEPEDVAQRFCAALDLGDWLGVIALTDPELLRDFADQRLEYARSLEREPEHRTDAGPPDAPPEVRRWFAERMARRPAPSPFAQSFAGIRTVAELEALDPVQFIVRALDGLFGRPPGNVARTWLGVVREEPGQAHAVYRIRFLADPDTDGSVGVLSMVRTSGDWRVLWDGQGPFGLPGFGSFTYIVGRVTQTTDPAA